MSRYSGKASREDVLINEADTTLLVGMLLDKHNLHIDVENGGRVLIQAKA